MTTYFITGIDTDIGKTYATGILARHLMLHGNSVITQKLIQTGVTGDIADDIITHRKLMGIKLHELDIDGTTCPIVLTKPASPHLSARLENRSLNTDIITHATKKLHTHFDIVLLEGAGGVLAPITDNLLTLDYIATQCYPVIVVTSARLGSINHTLLTLEAIRSRGLTLFGMVFNHHFDTDPDISSDTLAFLQKYVADNYPDTLFMRLIDGQMIGFERVIGK
ncbi:MULTISPECIES: dethiobiotin synthase [Moraxella]|uniref:dethiobiotin synthase n=1 Tax=Moraxella TaxID=475 RepID=UPI00359EC8BC